MDVNDEITKALIRQIRDTAAEAVLGKTFRGTLSNGDYYAIIIEKIKLEPMSIELRID